MRWIVLVCMLAAACGGTKVPLHSGYKSDKSKPWKNAKAIKLDDKGEGKADGALNYASHARARWYAIQLPSHGELTIRLEVTPPGDETNEDFDMALEVLDPGFRVIGKSDKEEEDAGELTKNKTLFDLEPGKYYIHLYLQGRLDSGDFNLKANFKGTKAGDKPSDFPAQVAFIDALPMVPLNDDTPKSYRPPVVTTTVRTRPVGTPKKPDEKPVATVLNARIVGVSVVGGGTRIVLGRGTLTGAATGMKAKLNGIAGVFAIECNENTCAAVVTATPDQIKSAGTTVVLLP
jgi:hypothetical protein